MSVLIELPRALHTEPGFQPELRVSAATVRAALEALEQGYPAIYRSICDETGSVRRHIHLFVNSRLVCETHEFDTALTPGDVLAIMTAVSGG